MTTTAVETATAYVFTVIDSEQNFVYEFCKQPPEGVKLTDYLQSCKREAELLATAEIAQNQPPTPITI